jgi:hypothetical protein
MRIFFWKGLLILISLELVSRIVVDPAFYYQVNTYTKNVEGFNFKQVYFPKKINHYNYLFIGSSKTISSIDVSEIERLNDTVVAINAGKGYSYFAFHYWALKRTLEKNPQILMNSKVIVELNGGINFTENFEKVKFTLNDNQPYMYIPHLNFGLLKDFIKYSDCRPSLKIKLMALYSCSLLRAAPFLFENLQRIGNQYKYTEDLAEGGGLKTDQESITMIRNMAIEGAKTNMEQQKFQNPLTEEDMNNSIMSKLKDLVINNGGQLIFLDMPQHSSQKAMYTTGLNLKNKEVFSLWAQKNGIKYLNTDDFSYNDDDFPDYFHINRNRMAEYTQIVFKKINQTD